MKGKLIKELFRGKKEPGIYQVKWYGEDETGVKVTSGIYLIVLTKENARIVRKITLIR